MFPIKQEFRKVNETADLNRFCSFKNFEDDRVKFKNLILLFVELSFLNLGYNKRGYF